MIPNAHHIDFRDRYSSLPSSFRTPQNSTRPTSNGSSLEFDAELEDLERHSTGPPLNTPAPLELGEGGQRSKASALTAGLVIHSLADGLALGVSSLAGTGAVNDVSLVVFLALLLHKGWLLHSFKAVRRSQNILVSRLAPTALALTTSLLSYNLPRSECKNYVAAFSAATPVSALVSYILFALFGNNGSHNWSGIALLVSVSTPFAFQCRAASSPQSISPEGAIADASVFREGAFCMWPRSFSLYHTLRQNIKT